MSIRLSKPYFSKTKNIMKLIKGVLYTGVLTQGKYVAQFEKMIADYLGVKHAIAVNSGTSALHLSLIALGIKDGDEVIVPAYTFPATANVVEAVGAKPVFVDVDLYTYNIDIKKIEKSITKKTKVIIPVHLFGNPADIGLILDIAKNNNLKIIEDSACALGSEYNGRKCGTIGEVGCFSFHPRKIITTGEGGAVVTNDDEIAEKIKVLRNHGIKTTRFYNEFITAGFNYRMNELQAILGIIQMKEIDNIITERQELAKKYMELFKNNSGVMIQKILPNSTSVWQAFVIYLKNVKNIHITMNYLRSKNIEVNIGTYALHILKFYRNKYGYKYSNYPNAYELHRKSIALPFYNGIKTRYLKYTANNLIGILN